MAADFKVWSDDLNHDAFKQHFNVWSVLACLANYWGGTTAAAAVVARRNKSSKEKAFSCIYPQTSLRKQESTVWKLPAGRQRVIVHCSSSVCQAELASYRQGYRHSSSLIQQWLRCFRNNRSTFKWRETDSKLFLFENLNWEETFSVFSLQFLRLKIKKDLSRKTVLPQNKKTRLLNYTTFPFSLV